MESKRLHWQQDGLDDPERYSNKGAPFKVWDPEVYLFLDQPVLPERYPVAEGEGNLVSALTTTGKYAPVLDIDMPCKLVPSKTPGHFHLYIDKELDWSDYLRLLTTLDVLGILEPGYVQAAVTARNTFVRSNPESRPDRGIGQENPC